MILTIILSVIGFLTLVSFVFIVLILTQKHRHQTQEKKIKAARDYLFAKYFDGKNVSLPVSNRFFIDALIDVEEQIKIEPSIRQAIINDFISPSLLHSYHRQLNSVSGYRRKMASYYLGAFKTAQTIGYIYERLLKEKNQAVRMNLIINMRHSLSGEHLLPIMESLINSRLLYQKRIATILATHYPEPDQIFIRFKDDLRYEVIYVLLRIASYHSTAITTKYMTDLYEKVETMPFDFTKRQTICDEILHNLLTHRPDLLGQEKYMRSPDFALRKFSILAMRYQPSLKCLNRLIADLDESDLDEARIETIAKTVFEKKEYVDHLIRIYNDLNSYKKTRIVEILSERIEYVILRTYNKNKPLLQSIISYMFLDKNISSLIDFLNHNPNPAIEEILLEMLEYELGRDEALLLEFRVYTSQRILAKLGLLSYSYPSEVKKKSPREVKKIIWVSTWLLFGVLLFPLIYVIRLNVQLFNMDIWSILQGFLIESNVYLIYYFASINVIYIMLFVIALIGSRRQVNLAKTRKFSLLFSDRLLPGISIIAPAYNEEVNVIDSVNSLLNLKYPNYEVIVVNDGSKDQTLAKLVDYFKLERKHLSYQAHLGTKKIRALYYSKEIPNLLVVDKQNGGKADALNVGINVSSKAYVCGIDADSVLEGDALLKLTSTMLDDTKPFIAMGGNIYPANGFKFDRGEVVSRSIPSGLVTRLQTIEYLRAFTSGRIGWSQIKSLMIISGAFGLFNKEALIETGGYLTSSGQYKKDTVGEDMELVVRLTRESLEQKRDYRVSYVYNAYCYTELPSDPKTLLKQRNRWQRGLVDILSFHRHIIFNPAFKQVGMIGAPYFFIYEFIGPLLEAFGLVMLVIATALGLLNLEILLAMFTVSIAFGVVISLSSLFMSEQEILMMSKNDTFILILYAILENFGYRQLVSLHRVQSTFSALKESGQWGLQKRTGFKR